MINVSIKSVDGLNIPFQANPNDAGYDIIATSEPKIVGDRVGLSYESVDYIEYETNLYMSSCDGFHALIHPRSSISKYNLVLANSIGLIDRDYTGHILLRFKYIWQPFDFNRESLHWKVDVSKIYKKGDKIGQLVFQPTIKAQFSVVDELSQTQRASGGFGSSGK